MPLTAANGHSKINEPAQRPADPHDVAGAVQQQLLDSPYVALRKLSCEFSEGVLILRGTVPTFHTKQMALAIVNRVKGAELFLDRIDVEWAKSR